eukprot:5712408-Prymnesium_polylepis.2
MCVFGARCTSPASSRNRTLPPSAFAQLTDHPRSRPRTPRQGGHATGANTMARASAAASGSPSGSSCRSRCAASALQSRVEPSLIGTVATQLIASTCSPRRARCSST